MTDDNEFYVGYAESMPARTGRFLRVFVWMVIVLAAGIGAVFAEGMNPLGPKVFEFGVEREFVGWIRETPVPRILVPSPDGRRTSSYLLAHGGTKFGAAELSAGFDGAQVRARGSLIYRGAHTMLDLVPGSLERVEGASAPEGTSEDLGVHRLVGEIVDSKCYFGVMNPATGKVHRSCAARCISSGTPPIIVATAPDGRTSQLLLVGPTGESLNQSVLSYVAETIAIEGRVTREDHLLVLWADPASIERL